MMPSHHPSAFRTTSFLLFLGILIYVAFKFLLMPAAQKTGDNIIFAPDIEEPAPAEPVSDAITPEPVLLPPPGPLLPVELDEQVVPDDSRIPEETEEEAGAASKDAPASPPAEPYQFRRTRWGMTMDEVLAAEDSPPIRSTPTALTFATTTLDVPCILTYSFRRGTLSGAHLQFSAADSTEIPPLTPTQAYRRYRWLFARLQERYGTPIQRETPLPRDTFTLEERAARRQEDIRQYTNSMAMATRRIEATRQRLQRKYRAWPDAEKRMARELEPEQRRLRDLLAWKKEAETEAADALRHIRQNKDADRTHPLMASLSARWPDARDAHSIELMADFRVIPPRVAIHYRPHPVLPPAFAPDDL